VTSPPHAATSAGPGVSAGPAFHDVPPSLLRAAPQGDLWWVMFDASPVACSIVDIASGSLIVNRAYRSLLGIAEGEEITMDHVRRRAHPDEIGELNERFGAMDRGETDRVEMDRRYVRDDGSVIWGHLVTTLVRDERGEPVAVVGQMEDITARMEAQRRLAAREARFRSLVQNALDTVVVVDAEGWVLYGTTGHDDPRERMITAGRHLADLVHAGDGAACRRLIEQVSARPFARAGVRVRPLVGAGDDDGGGDGGGGGRVAEAVATNLLGDADVGGIVVSMRDITELQRQLRTIRRQAAQLDEQNQRLSDQAEQLIIARDEAVESSRLHAARFEAGFEHSPIGIAAVDAAGRVQRVNPALCRMLDERPEDLTGRSLARLVETTSAADASALEDLCRHRAPVFAAESRCRRRDGAMVWTDVHIAALVDDQRRPLGFFAQIQDITDRRRSAQALAHQASHDSLTGLANRHHFLSESQCALGRARGPDDDVALLFIDVDRFKIVNDSVGHSVGDELLRQLSRRLVAALPRGAEVARLGGDEFGVMALVPRGSQQAARRLADRLHAACAPAFAVDGHEMLVSLSIGIVCTGEAQIDTEELLRRADAAMYRAKAAGRSTSRFLDETTLASLHARFELSTELGRAVERDELFLRYQPEVDLVTGELLGVEALLRWRHPRRGELAAGAFVTAAEESGQIVGIGAWVQRQAMTQAARWPRAPAGTGGRGLVTRINLAPQQLGQDRLAAQARELVDELAVAPGDICFEITESALLDFGEAARRNIDALAELGVHLAIDDFGAGYSSLRYLKDIPARTLKIDMSFVHGLEHDRRDRAIVASILDLAARLGFEVVAEGVETARQASILESLGCRRAQGFLFGSPVAPDEIEARLASEPGTGRRVC
jgi:diguanylate cyclase (GGDEF)-like protein/PAS domain S-box-containing protein